MLKVGLLTEIKPRRTDRQGVYPLVPIQGKPALGDDPGGAALVAVYFVETSALAKRYIAETGSVWL